MPIGHALDLLNALGDPALRDELYQCASTEELLAALAARGWRFTGPEFDDALNSLHLKCASALDASELMDRANWFRMLQDSVR